MSRIILSLSVVVGLNYFLACCHNEERPPVDPSKVVVVCANTDAVPSETAEFDAGGPPVEGAALTEKNVCKEACRSLANQECPESKQLPGGKDCETNCKDIRVISSYDPYCVARAKTVAAIRKCPQVECKK